MFNLSLNSAATVPLGTLAPTTISPEARWIKGKNDDWFDSEG